MVKLSVDGTIQEFNLEAEKYFGRKRENVINQDFISMFIPESFRKNTKTNMNKMLAKMEEGKIEIHVITDGAKIQVVEWYVTVLCNHLKLAAGILLIQKS